MTTKKTARKTAKKTIKKQPKIAAKKTVLKVTKTAKKKTAKKTAKKAAKKTIKKAATKTTKKAIKKNAHKKTAKKTTKKSSKPIKPWIPKYEQLAKENAAQSPTKEQSRMSKIGESAKEFITDYLRKNGKDITAIAIGTLAERIKHKTSKQALKSIAKFIDTH
jgi:hypothetical protein